MFFKIIKNWLLLLISIKNPIQVSSHMTCDRIFFKNFFTKFRFSDVS